MGDGRLRRLAFDLRSSICYLRGFPDFRIRIGFAHGSVQPAVEVVAKRSSAQQAEAVFFPEVIDLDNDVGHGRGQRAEAEGLRVRRQEPRASRCHSVLEQLVVFRLTQTSPQKA